MLAHVHSLCHKPVIWRYKLGMWPKRTLTLTTQYTDDSAAEDTKKGAVIQFRRGSPALVGGSCGCEMFLLLNRTHRLDGGRGVADEGDRPSSYTKDP